MRCKGKFNTEMICVHDFIICYREAKMGNKKSNAYGRMDSLVGIFIHSESEEKKFLEQFEITGMMAFQLSGFVLMEKSIEKAESENLLKHLKLQKYTDFFHPKKQQLLHLHQMY